MQYQIFDNHFDFFFFVSANLNFCQNLNIQRQTIAFSCLVNYTYPEIEDNVGYCLQSVEKLCSSHIFFLSAILNFRQMSAILLHLFSVSHLEFLTKLKYSRQTIASSFIVSYTNPENDYNFCYCFSLFDKSDLCGHFEFLY